GGKITVVQVDQVFQQFLQARANVAQSEATLETSLDRFKLLLGLPPRIPVDLDDSVLGPFILVDPKLDTLREEINAYQKARNRDLDAPPALADLRRQYQEFESLASRVAPFADAVAHELEEWGKTLDTAKADEQSQRVKAMYAQFRETLPEAARDLEI